MDFNIKLNNLYSKEEIEEIFNTNFGARIKGITLRRDENNSPYIILFSRADGPYTDNISGGIFYYDGEGLEGDQKLTTANKSLTEANTDFRPIYGFRQEASEGKWKYIGLLEVLDYDYARKNNRKVYEFKLRQKNIESIDEVLDEESKIEQDSSLPTPKLETERKTVSSQLSRKVRDEAFRRKIKKIYNDTCVVCRKKRYTNAKYPEVQAAHIYPVEKNGTDDLRNGITLCRLHHWAFDGGLFSITDELKTIVKKELLNDKNYDEITNYDASSILLPSPELYKPVRIFLQQHRILHEFE